MDKKWGEQRTNAKNTQQNEGIEGGKFSQSNPLSDL